MPTEKRPSSAELIETLSPRRREILELVSKGLTNADIAQVLGISPLTVRTHVTAVLAQVQVTNRTEATAAFVGWQSRPSRVAEVLARPAIAVLPFRSPEDDPRAATVAAAMSRDVASLFARWSWFPVIAGSSTVGARQPGDTAITLGSRLGARFLVEGDVRLDASSWRLEVRIDDADTGHELWAERVSFPREALFEVQETVCATIVSAAYPVLVATVQLAPRPQPTTDLEAWELAHAGMSFVAQREAASNEQASARFDAALERDPRLVLAHFGSGLASYDALLNQWGPSHVVSDRLLASANRCLDLAPHMAEGWFLLARHAQGSGDHARAEHPLEAAIARNPSFAPAHALLGQVLQLIGRSDEALARMKHAVRLGPRSFVAGLASLHFAREEYGLALDAAEHALTCNPRYTFARALAAAAAYMADDHARASRHATFLTAADFRPDLFRERFVGRFEAVDRLANALARVTARP